MSDQPRYETAPVRFRLGDYVAVQTWMRSRNFLRTILIYMVTVAATVLVINFISDGSLNQAVGDLTAFESLYAETFAVGFVIVLLLPYFFVLIFWLVGKLPKEASFSFDANSVGYSSGGQNITIQWGSVLSVNKTRGAYYVRSKQRLIRMPLRAFSAEQIAALDKFVANRNPTAL